MIRINHNRWFVWQSSSPLGVVETPAYSSFNSSYRTLTMVSMLRFWNLCTFYTNQLSICRMSKPLVAKGSVQFSGAVWVRLSVAETCSACDLPVDPGKYFFISTTISFWLALLLLIQLNRNRLLRGLNVRCVPVDPIQWCKYRGTSSCLANNQ